MWYCIYVDEIRQIMLTKLFKELGLGENEEAIYQALIEKGSMTARQLSDQLSIQRTSVYDYIETLRDKGLVVERVEGNKKLFQADDPKNLLSLLKSKIHSLSEEEKALKEALPSLSAAAASVQPRIKFYSGIEGVKQVLNDFQWQSNIETVSFWPISEMIDVLGKDYFEQLNINRIRQKIFTKALWPEDKKVSLKENPFMGCGKAFYRDIRIAPKHITWDMGYWIYGDKVAFVSSKKEVFGFVIQSKDFAQMMHAQFDVAWNISKLLKPEPQHTDTFLKRV
jgi:HTH-type transcriptional regulator, sugar sensing transcriptional regulator